eukprot:m.36705 g.36705  ORF g.36705 m.36705 type:complete len:441 (+) comp9710_c0_seq3:1328-2650(+)
MCPREARRRPRSATTAMVRPLCVWFSLSVKFSLFCLLCVCLRGCSFSAGGRGVITLLVRLRAFPLGDMDAAKTQGLVNLLAAMIETNSACVQISQMGADKNNEGFVSISVVGLNTKSTSVVMTLNGPSDALSAYFQTAIEITDAIATENTRDKGNDVEPITSGPIVASCTATGTSAVYFTLRIPTFPLGTFTFARQMIMQNFFGSALNIEGGCIYVETSGYTSDGTPFFDLVVSPVNNAQVVYGMLLVADLTNLNDLVFDGVPASLINPRYDSGNGAPKDPYLPSSAAPAVTSTTFDYFMLIPLAINNIDTVTGVFKPEFQTRVADGCAADRNFCIAIMNVLTLYINTLSFPTESSDKSDSMYATRGGSDSSLSTASVAAIAGSAVAFVAVIALVVAKAKTGRFLPFRPSSRVSFSPSDMRSLSSPSRISVRAWPNAMEV